MPSTFFSKHASRRRLLFKVFLTTWKVSYCIIDIKLLTSITKVTDNDYSRSQPTGDNFQFHFVHKKQQRNSSTIYSWSKFKTFSAPPVFWQRKGNHFHWPWSAVGKASGVCVHLRTGLRQSQWPQLHCSSIQDNWEGKAEDKFVWQKIGENSLVPKCQWPTQMTIFGEDSMSWREPSKLVCHENSRPDSIWSSWAINQDIPCIPQTIIKEMDRTHLSHSKHTPSIQPTYVGYRYHDIEWSLQAIAASLADDEPAMSCNSDRKDRFPREDVFVFRSLKIEPW